MADETPEHEAPAETVDELAEKQQQQESKLDSLSEKVDRVLDWLTGKQGQSAEKAKPTADVASEVERGVQRVRAADDRKARADAEAEWKTGIEQAINDLRSGRERKPLEMNWATRTMGWVNEDEL